MFDISGREMEQILEDIDVKTKLYQDTVSSYTSWSKLFRMKSVDINYYNKTGYSRHYIDTILGKKRSDAYITPKADK